MKFQVPQFIDIEDKMFGPLSFKEFSYVAGGCGLSYLLYRYIPWFLVALLLIIPVLGFAAALAFYRPNNKPFIEMVQSALAFAIGKKLYIWKKNKNLLQTNKFSSLDSDTNLEMPMLSQNKLAQTETDLDIRSGAGASKNIKDSLNLKI